MFGYWKKINEIQSRIKDLEERVQHVEEYMYRQDIDKVLKDYSKKYGVEISLHAYLHSGQFYLVANGKDKICGLECFRNDWADAYREVCRMENRIKAFMYDKSIEEKLKEEETNDKE